MTKMARLGAPPLRLPGLLVLTCLVHVASAFNLTGYPADYIFIDCGSLEEPGRDENSFTTNITTVAAGTVSYTVTGAWMEGTVSNQPNLSPEEATFRSFSSKRGCYNIEVPEHTYSVRLGFAYFAYDGQYGGAPNFTVSVQGVVVDQVALNDWENITAYDRVGTQPWGGLPNAAHYTEYVATMDTGVLEICLESVNNRSPLVNTIELVPTDIPEMNRFLPEMKWKLSLKKRFNMGGSTVGPKVEEDALLRKWEEAPEGAQIYFLFPLVNIMRPVYSNVSISRPTNESTPAAVKSLVDVKDGLPPFPPAIFETALRGGMLNESDARRPQFMGIRLNYFPYSSFDQLLIRLFFAEIDGNATKTGQRVFNISFAAKVARDKYLWEGQWHDQDQSDDFDIIKRAGGADTGILAPFIGCYPEPVDHRKNVSLFLFLSSKHSELPPMLSAVELYEVISPLPKQTCPKLVMQPGWNASDAEPPTSEEEAPSEGLSAGAIVGIVMACVVGGTLLIVGLVVLVKHRAQQKATSFHRFQSEGLVSEGA